MRNLTKVLALTSAAALSFGVASCSSSNGDNKAAGGKAIISTYGSEPTNPLIPAMTNEVGGGTIIDAIFAGLVYYDKDGNVKNEMANSITPSADNTTFTVKLKDGMKFSDGSAVTSDSFIKAWKYAVEKDLANRTFFEPIKGFEDKSLSGLQKVDDTTFTITLKQPESDFPLRLGYQAFYPLPEVAFKDMKAFGEHPIGNGIYKLSEWTHKVSVEVVPNENYTGTRELDNDGVDFKFYASPEAAYVDLQGGNLDVMAGIPANARATYKQDLNGRALSQPSPSIYYIGIRMDSPHFSGEEGKLRRQALSMAMNRPEVIDKILEGGPTPAKNFSAPVISGYNPDIPGNEVLKFNPEKAQQMWEKANAIAPWGDNDEFTIAYNADGGGQEQIDAYVNQIKNTLKIKAHGEPFPDFKSFRSAAKKGEIKGGFIKGWVADYPSTANFLIPLFTPVAAANNVAYDNPAFNEALTKAAAAPSVEEANKLYNQAQTYLLEDLPAIPLHNGALAAGYGEDVENVAFNWKSAPILNEIRKKTS